MNTPPEALPRHESSAQSTGAPQTGDGNRLAAQTANVPLHARKAADPPGDGQLVRLVQMALAH